MKHRNEHQAKRPLLRRLLPVCASVLALSACAPGGNAPAQKPPAAPAGNTPAAQPATAAWQHQAALDKAVAHILATQKKAGDWGYMDERPNDIYLGSINSLHVWGNASTALCLMGLLDLPPTAEINGALRKGFEYLITAPDTPRATMDTFYNVWSHCYMIQALVAATQDARFAADKERLRKRAEHELRRLMDHQGLDGGWGYYDFEHRTLRPSGDISTTFTTAAAMIALYEGRAGGLSIRDHNVEIGLDYLVRHRIPNGAYYYSSGHMHYPLGDANQVRGSIGRSQSGDNALAAWGRKLTAKDIQDALDRFYKEHVFIEIGRGRQFPHEAWYATAPYYYYFGHYYASRNVLLLPADVRPAYAAKLADLVVAGQYDDGSFWDYPLYGYTKAYGTGYGVMILNNCKKAFAGK